jgi:hypothetical protein
VSWAATCTDAVQLPLLHIQVEKGGAAEQRAVAQRDTHLLRMRSCRCDQARAGVWALKHGRTLGYVTIIMRAPGFARLLISWYSFSSIFCITGSPASFAVRNASQS